MAESSDITITQCISTLDSGFDSEFHNVDLVRRQRQKQKLAQQDRGNERVRSTVILV